MAKLLFCVWLVLLPSQAAGCALHPHEHGAHAALTPLFNSSADSFSQDGNCETINRECAHNPCSANPMQELSSTPADHFYCPCCGHTEPKKEMVRWTCPKCKSKERHRVVCLALANQKELNFCSDEMDGEVMYFAPENSIGSVLSCNPGLTITTADFECQTVDKPGTDLSNLKDVADGALQGLVANHLLEHIPDYKKALSEVNRVLKPNGFAVLQTPSTSKLTTSKEDSSCTSRECREKTFGQADHVRVFAKEELKAAVTAAGFSLQEVDYSHFDTDGKMQLKITTDWHFIADKVSNTMETNEADTNFWVIQKK